MKTPLKILFLFCLSLSSFSLAAEGSDPLPLSLDEAWRLLENHNPGLRRLLLDQAAALREAESPGTWIPSVGAGTSLSRSAPFISGFTNASDAEKNETDFWSLRGSLDLRLSLKPNLSLEKQARALELNLVLLQREEKIRDLQADLRKLYYQILAGAKTLEVQEKTLELTHTRLAQIEAQYNRGFRSDLELLTAQIAAARDLPALQKARVDQEKRLLTLREYLGLEPETPVELIPPPEEDLPMVPDRGSLPALLRNNHEIRMVRLQWEQARVNRDLTERNLLGPTLGLSLGWSSSINPLFASESWSSREWSDSLGLGLSLSIPLEGRITGSGDDLTLAALGDTIEKWELTLEETLGRVERELRSLMLDLELSRSNIEVSELNVTLQENNFEKLRESFENGRTSLLDLDDSRQELQEARLALENERLNRRLLMIEWGRITGQDGS